MKALLQLATSKGFKPKTVTTGWTVKSKIGYKKTGDWLVTPMCEYLVLCELKKWLQSTFSIYCTISHYTLEEAPDVKFTWDLVSNLIKNEDEDDLVYEFKSEEEALNDILTVALNLLPDVEPVTETLEL